METNNQNVKKQLLKTLAHGALWLLISIFTLGRLAQAWIATIYDWDTAELLIDADLEDRTPANFANIRAKFRRIFAQIWQYSSEYWTEWTSRVRTAAVKQVKALGMSHAV